ncbi:sensor histidine kinase KdpD [Mangrovicoccus sp. HB161399]|uniref:sensor histidine kinase n=1 Tax=Mangrovicoccus sp. HB161399 TaxID=2720392 RepID=UPI001554AA91|nr:HAMP domain-containing sensor histidine kinase [Mangrovicoccus sp. HB161399]
MVAGRPDFSPLPVVPLAPGEAASAERGAFAEIAGVPSGARSTLVTVRDSFMPPLAPPVLSIAILSSGLHYPVADIGSAPDLAAARKLGSIIRVVATYCGDPVLLARNAEGAWFRIEGSSIWSCAAVPRDNRLIAGGLAVLGLAAALSSAGRTAQAFRHFAETLAVRQQPGSAAFPAGTGPAELRDISLALAARLEEEQARMEKRAEYLSHVSHDLGSPATRLRLRAALIDDPQLRDRLSADIDQMTGMIEGVLAYTRTELDDEQPREISLSALLAAIADDYRDLGLPVRLLQLPEEHVSTAATVFLNPAGRHALPAGRRVLVTARARALRRAIVNLAENALKYGGAARLGLQADASSACITVEDDGGTVDPALLQQLTAPFRRGTNCGGQDGFGLGLAVATTVAQQHGGELIFEQAERGLRVRLLIRRL